MEKHLHSKQEMDVRYPAPRNIEVYLMFKLLSFGSFKRKISYLIVILIFFISTSLDAQSISRSVIGIAGGQNNLEGKTVNWTLGEAFIGSLKSDHPTAFVSVGFQQGNIQVSPETNSSNLAINLSPNPTRGWLNIQLLEKEEQDLTVQVSDISGKLLTLPQKLQGYTTELDLAPYPAGVYFLVLRRNSALVQTYKVVKTQ